jgi:hypothetical protein
MKKIIKITALVAIFVTATASAFDFDGKFDASQYDSVFNVTYEVCGGKSCVNSERVTVTGGTLAFATDGTDQYLYFAHPKGFKDNSYAPTSAPAYLVGWGGQDHKYDKHVGSEEFVFQLVSSDDGTHEVTVTYDGTVDETASGSFGAQVTAKSSAAYNNTVWQSSVDDAAKFSPETIAPDGGNCVDESDSSDACYELKPANAGIDFQFAAGVELKLTNSGSKFFNIDTGSMTLQNARDLVTLVSTHASPAKLTSNKEPDTRTIVECTTNCGDTPPPQAPEPATMGLVGLAFLGLGYYRRRRMS